MDTSGSLPIGARAAKVAVRAAGEVVGLASPHDLLHACLLELGAGGDAVTQSAAEGASLLVVVVASVDLLVHGVHDGGEHRRDPLLRLDEQVLEVEEDALVDVLIDERRSDACLAAAASATDAMDVVLDLLRHVEVDHVLYVGEVQTLGGDVSADEHILLLVLEHADRILALLLILACVDAHRLDALEHEVLVDVVDVSLALAEDEHGRRGLL
mmetsp:Transcript_21146/g.50368  ORF Transcript_21146/g.50368 Transcript_21146/m.50368 type:complete len:213 (+) Transcript_21146:145-783(+)